MKDAYYYEDIATKLISEGKVFKGMAEEDVVSQIYSQLKKENSKTKVKYLMNIDEDFLSDAVSTIYERLK
jgi:hypothetical protein